MVYKYNGVFFSLKREGNFNICNNMDDTSGYDAKWHVFHRRINTAWFHLYDIYNIVKFVESETEMLVTKG